MLAARPGQNQYHLFQCWMKGSNSFSKDSLWQSEDLESVVDEDVQRTCILHGPVASQYTSKVDEPIGDILNSIHEGHIARLIKEEYAGDESKIPVVEYFGGKKPASVSATSVNVTDGNQVVYEIDSELPNKQEWLDLLAGTELNWLQAFISTDRIVQGSKHVSNPLHDILTPAKHSKVTIDKKTKKLTAFENIKGDLLPVVEIELVKPNTIQLSLIEHRTADANPVALPFLYKYNPADGFAPILEIMEDRNERIKEFYWKLWFGSSVPYSNDINVEKAILGDEITISSQTISEFTHAIGNKCDAFVDRPGKATLAPMDFAIVIGWKAIIKAIFLRALMVTC